ncbi:MAG: winged helix-turn-helix domain-containing protein [Alphaproteobacteria bacterium]
MTAAPRSASAAVRRTLDDLLACIPDAGNGALSIEDTLHPVSGANEAPTLRLTAKPESADDIACPVAPHVLVQRIAARLASGAALGNGWRHDATGRRLTHPEHEPVALTEKESLLLSALLGRHPEPCTRESLLKDVWAYGEQAETHTLETHVYRLRAKLAALEPRPCDIVTVDSSYRLVV